MSSSKKSVCFLCGVGGSGMSALVPVLQSRGWVVRGSDRGRDKGQTPGKFQALADQGVVLYPQDGSGLDENVRMLVVSSAVEDTIPDVRAAKTLGIPIRKRAEILAEIINGAALSVAVGGTSGKSTTTAMIGCILDHAARQPTIINGAVMKNTGAASVAGDPACVVAEVDESDGSIVLYRPSVAVLTNISLDHKPLAELRGLFSGFLGAAAQAVVLNVDDAESLEFADQYPEALTVAVDNGFARFQACDIVPHARGMSIGFRAVDHATGAEAPVHLAVPGRHNVANAMMALAAGVASGVGLAAGAAALAGYAGIRRRFDVIGTSRGGVTVIDDFAHNPDKIAATLRTLHDQPGRVWAVFQPHGFGPTKLMKDDLIRAFSDNLVPGDVLVMPEIYYAGGTAAKDISSNDIIAALARHGQRGHFFERRTDIPAFLAAHVAPGDRVVVMGARDDTLPEFAESILSAIDTAGAGLVA